MAYTTSARLFERFYPSYESQDDVFDEVVKVHLGPDVRVLDAGCGDGTITRYGHKRHAKVIVGIDLDEGIGRNENIHFAVRGDLEMMPFNDDSFEVVLCKYVVEHLEDPGKVFREFNRVLGDGGVVIVHAPNMFHYVQVIARLTPYWLHRIIIGRILSRDTFPKHYEANSRRKISELMRQAGFVPLAVKMFESAPDYLAFSFLGYMMGVVYERTVNRFAVLAFLRLNIIATFRKCQPA